jgi:hypothetical protein
MHDLTFQKIIIFTISAMKTSNLPLGKCPLGRPRRGG